MSIELDTLTATLAVEQTILQKIKDEKDRQVTAQEERIGAIQSKIDSLTQ